MGIPQVWRWGWVCLGSLGICPVGMFSGGIPEGGEGMPDGYTRGQVWGMGMYTPWTWDLGYPPPVLTSSGGHHNMYTWQAGGSILLECFLV